MLVNYFDNRLTTAVIFEPKCHFAGSSFLNVRICPFSLTLMSENEFQNVTFLAFFVDYYSMTHETSDKYLKLQPLRKAFSCFDRCFIHHTFR